MSKGTQGDSGIAAAGPSSAASRVESGSVSSRSSFSPSSLQGEASRSLSSSSGSGFERSSGSTPAPLHFARLSFSHSDSSPATRDSGSSSKDKVVHSNPAQVERVSHTSKPTEARTLTEKGDSQTKPLLESLSTLQPPVKSDLPRVFLVEQNNRSEAERMLGAPAQDKVAKPAAQTESKPVETADATAAKTAAPTDNKVVQAPPFDATKKLADQPAAALTDRTGQAEVPNKEKLAPGEVPTLKVAMTNPSDQNAPKPDFLVRKDGSVEMFSNPQETGQKEIVIQYERNGDSTQLTDEQKAAGGALYNLLTKQLSDGNPLQAAKVDDSQGLLRDSQLPEDVRKNLDNPQTKAPEAQVNPASGLPERSGRTMQDTNRISNGGSHADVPRSQVNDMTPPATRIPNEQDRMRAMKDTVASYTTRGEQKPYEYAAKRGDRGWGVGRYGMTYGQVGSWLEGLSDEQIEEMIKQGKLSPSAAANLKKMRDSIKKSKASGDEKDLDPFLAKMKNGEGTEDEMKAMVKENLPDQVQELMASDTISKISWEQAQGQNGEQKSADPGRVALSFVLGRNVSKEEAEGNPDYKKFVDSARQAYRIQEQSGVQRGDVIRVENMSQVTDALNKMVGEQFWREAAGATEYGNKGCAIAVTRALQRMGVDISTNLAVTNTAQDMRRRGWQEVSLAQAMRSGQLFVPVNKETGSHIGIGLGSQVWENSSGQRQFVTRQMSQSTLRNSGRAFIVPIAAKDAPTPNRA